MLGGLEPIGEGLSRYLVTGEEVDVEPRDFDLSRPGIDILGRYLAPGTFRGESFAPPSGSFAPK